MSHVATVLTGSSGAWQVEELDLAPYGDVDSVTDAVRDLLPDDDALGLLFVEEDDEWFAVLRLDDRDADARIFLSDVRAVETSELAALLYGDVEPQEVSVDDDEDSPPPTGEPGGDDTVVADLGTPAPRLRELCGAEHLLPSDVVAELWDRMGCAELVEELRLA